MSLMSELSKTDKGLYHAQINPAIGEDRQMKDTDWLKAADILETELGLMGQNRVIVIHGKKNRLHAHVVWERYDHEKGRMISDSFSRLAQNRARLTIEKELGHKPTPERKAKALPMKEALTELWKTSKTASLFIEQAQQIGFLIAAGADRRPFKVIDQQGQRFDLLKQLDGIKTREVREQFKNLILPTEQAALDSLRNTPVLYYQ